MSKILIPLSEIKAVYLGGCQENLAITRRYEAMCGQSPQDCGEITPTLAGFIAYCRPFFNSEQFEIMHIPSKQRKNATKTDNI